jgi:peptidoglycan/LPS O-acetylase OafA/YrhL
MVKDLIRNLIAALAGALTGIFVLTASQIFAAQHHPLPAHIDPKDKAAMGEFIAAAPASALLIVLAGYFVGITAATWVAGRLSAHARLRQALMVGGLFLVASIINLTSFSHPAWFWVANLAVVVAATWLGIKLLPAPRAAK